MKRQIRIIFLLLIISNQVFSQKPIWDIGINSFFDNTEFGTSKVQSPQTMAGVRFAPGIGLEWDSINTVIAGVNILHEFGSNKTIGDISLVAYYRFNKKPFQFLMGAFPRSYILEKYPRIFFQDSISYYRPNINGILWEYSKPSVLLSLWLDWTGRQSVDTREAFFMGFSGKYKTGPFYIQNFSYMYHFSTPLNPLINEALHDNGMVLTSAGIDLSGMTVFDKLDLNIGWVVGVERARADNTGWVKQNGLLSQQRLQFKWIGIFNTLYIGDSQMEFYNDHHNELYWGDPFYRAKKYDRADLYIDFIKSKSVSTRLIYSLHFAENTVYHEQALKVTINLNNLSANH